MTLEILGGNEFCERICWRNERKGKPAGAIRLIDPHFLKRGFERHEERQCGFEKPVVPVPDLTECIAIPFGRDWESGCSSIGVAVKSAG